MLNRIFPKSHRFRCPEEHQLAAYVDQQLIGAERERVESHLAKCDSCLQQVGFLTRQSEVTTAPPPAGLLRRAEQIRFPAQASSPVIWRWAGAVAAVVLVSVSVAVWRKVPTHLQESPTVVATTRLPQVPDDAKLPNVEADTSVRGVSQHVSLPIVVVPQPGATLQVSDCVIRWEPVPNASSYEVRVVTADGDLVWRKRVRENSIKLPNRTLRTGVKYFVWVRALLRDGSTQQSAAVNFIGG